VKKKQGGECWLEEKGLGKDVPKSGAWEKGGGIWRIGPERQLSCNYTPGKEEKKREESHNKKNKEERDQMNGVASPAILTGEKKKGPKKTKGDEEKRGKKKAEYLWVALKKKGKNATYSEEAKKQSPSSHESNGAAVQEREKVSTERGCGEKNVMQKRGGRDRGSLSGEEQKPKISDTYLLQCPT